MEPPRDPTNDKNEAPRAPAPEQSAAQRARTVAVYLARLFWPAAIYLGATGLDLIYAARLGLLMRSRAKAPDRAGDFDAQMARLKEQKSRRWAPWEMLSDRRRFEIRCAATVIVVAAVLGLRAYLTRGVSSPDQQVAYQPTPAYAPSTPSAPGFASIPTPSATPAVDQALLDAKDFAQYRKQAAPGQWIVYGVEPLESARAKLAEAEAQMKSARAAEMAADKKLELSRGKPSENAVIAEFRAARDESYAKEQAYEAA
jgi:hypothetical protein